MRVEREVCELWGEALGVLAFEVSLVKTSMPADLCFSEGVMGVVMLLADGEVKIEVRRCCWAAVSVSIGELTPDVSTDLEEEWAEWGMWL